MLKYKSKEIQKDNYFIVPLENLFLTADKEEAISSFYIEEQVAKSIPEQKDYEIRKYEPTVDEINIRLYKEEGVPFTYADFGFTDSDLLYFYNRLRLSFLNLSFYTHPNKLQRTQKFQISLFVQRENLFDGFEIKKASECEVFFNIKNPKFFNNQTEGYFIYLKIFEYTAPFSLYCNFKFNNALDGNSFIVYPYKNLTIQNVVEQNEYVEVFFNPKNFIFDTNQNTLTYLPNVLNIDLYALIV